MRWISLAECDSATRTRRITKALPEAWGKEGASVAQALTEMCADPAAAAALNRVIPVLANSSHPTRTAESLQAAVNKLLKERGDPSPLFVEGVLSPILELAAVSARGARILAVQPGLAIQIATRLKSHDPELPDMTEIGERIFQHVGIKNERYSRLLRHIRHEALLQIALYEVLTEDLRQSSSALADLADILIEGSLRHAIQRRTGKPENREAPGEFCVIGMGKLGGHELNFSSDIDVIFVYQATSDDPQTAHQFFTKISEHVVQLLSEPTSDGIVFRVDLDLRPEGRQGALCNSMAAIERYYEVWGRTWERAAWIKARPVAGSNQLGATILKALRPFVYRRSIDPQLLDALYDLKKDLNRSLSPSQDNLKLGRGGIREIEFIVQGLQLMYGGKDHSLRHRNTLRAITALEAVGLIGTKPARLLADAYLFFRKTEHRIQIEQESQTHALPASEGARLRISRSLGFADVSSFETMVRSYQDRVIEIYESFLGPTKDDDEDDLGRTLQTARSSADLESVARRLGARDSVQAAHWLKRLKNMQGPFHPKSDRTLRDLAHPLLKTAAESPDPDRTLRYLPDMLRTLMRHSEYLRMLKNPQIQVNLARILGSSEHLAKIITRRPDLLSETILYRTQDPTRDLDDYLPAAPYGETESALHALRRIKQRFTLRVAEQDLALNMTTTQVGDSLSRLAERIVQITLALAENEVQERFGAPDDSKAELVLLAGGTLGAREMGYRTDLDLVALYSGRGFTRGGSRGRTTVGEFFTSIVQKLISYLSMTSTGGTLYPVDTRLRPSGNQGLLISSLESFCRYHNEASSIWEKQALVRARVMASCGTHNNLTQKVEEAIHHVLRAIDPARALCHAHEMLQRLRTQAPNQRGTFDLKLGMGGLTEIEFLTQALSMGPPQPETPEAPRTTSTPALLDRLQSNSMSEDDIEVLKDAHAQLRRALNWQRLLHDRVTDAVPKHPELLQPLARVLGLAGESTGEQLLRNVELLTHRVASIAALLWRQRES